MIRIVFQLTRKELFKGLLAVSNSGSGARATRLIGVLFLLGSVLVIAMAIYSNRNPPSIAWLAILYGLGITFFPEIMIWIQMKKLAKRNGQVTESVTYTFGQTNFELAGESSLTQMDYTKLYEVREMSDFILLKVSGGVAQLIPKRAFSTDQLATFKEIIQSIPNIKTRWIHRESVK